MKYIRALVKFQQIKTLRGFGEISLIGEGSAFFQNLALSITRSFDEAAQKAQGAELFESQKSRWYIVSVPLLRYLEEVIVE